MIYYEIVNYIENIKQLGMSRHRRAMSDLQGVKSAKSLGGDSGKQSQKTMDSHNLSIYQPKTASAKLKKSYCPETPGKKADTQQIILDSYKLLKHFYQNEDTEYFDRVRKYLSGQWQSHKKNFIEHLNKLTYMEEEMQKRNYHEIELQVVGEWRKNHVLYCIRAFWYQFISNAKFGSIGDFMKKYNLFKDFIGQLAFLFFKTFFSNISSQKESQKVLDKLTERTSHLIITHTTTWCKICDKKIMPLIKMKLSSNIGDVQSANFDFNQMGIKTIAVDLDAEEIQMPKTADSIQKFILQHKILQKMKLLLDIRQNMENQIKKRQQNLIEQGILNEIKVLDKDDFVDCLVYCVVKSDINLENLGVSIKYFYYILGVDAHNILSKFRCDPYLADLEAVYDFLVLQAQKNKNCESNN